MRDKLLAKGVPLYFLFLFFFFFPLPSSSIPFFLSSSDAYKGRPTTRSEHNFRFRRYSQLRSIISCELSPPVNGKSYYRVSQTVCRAEYREVLIRIRRFIIKIVGVNVKGRERGLKSFDWKYSLSSIWLTMIETNDGLINEWLKRFERSIYIKECLFLVSIKERIFIYWKKNVWTVYYSFFRKFFWKKIVHS